MNAFTFAVNNAWYFSPQKHPDKQGVMHFMFSICNDNMKNSAVSHYGEKYKERVCINSVQCWEVRTMHVRSHTMEPKIKLDK